MSQANDDVRSLGDLKSEDILKEIDGEDIDHLSCDRCGHEWEPEKHPADLSRPGCPRNDCGHQSKYDILVHADVDYDAFGEPESDPLSPDEPEGDADLDFSSAFESESEFEFGVSFAQMSPGEFIEWFFHEDLDEIKVDSVTLLSGKCARGRKIPTEAKMEEILKGLKKPSNQNDYKREWIAEAYWERAKTYLAEKLGQTELDIERMVHQNNAGWVRTDPGGGMGTPGQQQSPSGGAGGVLDMGAGQQNGQAGVGDTTVVPGQHGQQPMGNGQYQQNGQNGQQAQQDSGPDEVMLKYFEKLVEHQQKLAKRLEHVERGGQESQSAADQLAEFVQVKQQMEKLTDDGQNANDQQMQKLARVMNQRMQKLEQEFEQAGSGDPAAAAGDEMTGMLAMMAQSEDIDNEVVTDLATRVFAKEGDPEVKKKEIDAEIERERMKNKQHMIDGIFTGIEGVAETFTGSAIDAVLDGMGGGDPEPEPAGEPREVQRADGQPSDSFSGSDPLGGDSIMDEIEREYAEADGGVSMDDSDVLPEFEDEPVADEGGD